MDLSVLELEVVGRTLRVTLEGDIDDPSLDDIAAASKVVSELLDGIDDIGFLNQRYELEVSSPGIERPLMTPNHFARHVGSLIEIRLADAEAAQYRLSGFDEATDEVSLDDPRGKGESVKVSLSDIVSARTLFEWPSKAPRRSDTAPSTRDRGALGSSEHEDEWVDDDEDAVDEER
jgi:ribosome maturation factor RimP